MHTLNINTIANAFTKTAKSENGEVLREAISKFDFAVNLDYDLSSPKMKQIISNLIIETIKVSIKLRIVQSYGTKKLLHKNLKNTPPPLLKTGYMNLYALIITACSA